MTLSNDIAALDALAKLETKLRDGLPELDRRARISSKRDGFPARASGAQPGTVTRAPDAFTSSTFRMAAGDGWGWQCSCGTSGTGVGVLSQVTGAPSPWWASSFGALQEAHRHYDAAHGSTTAIDYSDPTGEAAAASADGFRPDPVHRRHQRAVRELAKAVRSMEIAVAQLTEPTDVADNEPWCANCQRVKHADGKPHLEPVYSKARGKTDVGKRLAEPQYLCRFDYDYVLGMGSLPPLAFTTERLTKGRAPRKLAS